MVGEKQSSFLDQGAADTHRPVRSPVHTDRE